MSNNTNYIFNNYEEKDEILYLLNESKPIKVKSLDIVDNDKYKDVQHRYGEYDIQIINPQGQTIYLNFQDLGSDINDLWKFLEFTTTNDEPCILYIDDDGNEQVLYIESINNEDVRCFIAETMTAYHKFCRDEIKTYSFKDADILLDIQINKRVIINEFYNCLLRMFDGWEKVDDFAPYATDINYWQKDSNIIKKYVEDKKTL